MNKKLNDHDDDDDEFKLKKKKSGNTFKFILFHFLIEYFLFLNRTGAGSL